jgi:hypothetical protein
LPEEGCDVKEVMALHFYAFIKDIVLICGCGGCEVEENICPLDMDLLAVC